MSETQTQTPPVEGDQSQEGQGNQTPPVNTPPAPDAQASQSPKKGATPKAATAPKHPSKTLAECDQVVVQVGPRMALVDGEAEEIEAAHTNVYPAAWYEGLYRLQNGKTAQFPTKLLGYPVYTDDTKTKYEIGPIDEKSTVKSED